MDPLACAMTLHPGGSIGVESKLNGPLKCSHAEMCEYCSDCRRRLTVILACGRSRSHLFMGKAGSVAANIEYCRFSIIDADFRFYMIF